SWWARARYSSRSRLVKAAALPQHGRKALRIHPPATRAAGRPAPSASLVLDLDAGDSVRLRVRHRARGRHDLARGAAQTIPADVDRMGKLVGLHARTVHGLAKEAQAQPKLLHLPLRVRELTVEDLGLPRAQGRHVGPVRAVRLDDHARDRDLDGIGKAQPPFPLEGDPEG